MSKYIITLFIFLGMTWSAEAQRKVSYPQLVMRSQTPTIFIDDLVLPGDEGKTSLSFIFRFNHDFIPFKKIPLDQDLNAPDKAEFYSTIRLSTEIFGGKREQRDEAAMTSVSRDIWTDTLYTSNYDETISDKYFTSGSLTTQLKPGDYNYILQLSMMQEVRERNTQRRNISIPDLRSKKTGEVFLLKTSNEEQAASALYPLMNMENNVPFGKDFRVMIRIPEYDSSRSYQVKVHRIQPNKDDTSTMNQVFSGDLMKEKIYTNTTARLTASGKRPAIELQEDASGYTYSIADIPGSTFENASYRLTLSLKGEQKPLAQKVIRSYWANMPASLYNLDIAIEMLRYILPEKELERMKSGSDKEKEKKLRDFWESKDPTPKTVYNELMAEYYRRIDYAFKEFGSQENPMGHENDMGEIYIKFGPPSSKERRFPESGKTIEIWKYPNHTFLFEASTGFGDFVLKGKR